MPFKGFFVNTDNEEGVHRSVRLTLVLNTSKKKKYRMRPEGQLQRVAVPWLKTRTIDGQSVWEITAVHYGLFARLSLLLEVQGRSTTMQLQVK